MVGEVEDQAAVVEVASNPAHPSEGVVEIDQVVETGK